MNSVEQARIEAIEAVIEQVFPVTGYLQIQTNVSGSVKHCTFTLNGYTSVDINEYVTNQVKIADYMLFTFSPSGMLRFGVNLNVNSDDIEYCIANSFDYNLFFQTKNGLHSSFIEIISKAKKQAIKNAKTTHMGKVVFVVKTLSAEINHGNYLDKLVDIVYNLAGTEHMEADTPIPEFLMEYFAYHAKHHEVREWYDWFMGEEVK